MVEVEGSKRQWNRQKRKANGGGRMESRRNKDIEVRKEEARRCWAGEKSP